MKSDERWDGMDVSVNRLKEVGTNTFVTKMGTRFRANGGSVFELNAKTSNNQ